jgi:hypothetical protein
MSSKARNVSAVWIDAKPTVALIVTGVSLRTAPTRALNATWARPDAREMVRGTVIAASLLWSCTNTAESPRTGPEKARTNDTVLPATGLFVSAINDAGTGNDWPGRNEGDAMTTSMAASTVRRAIRFLIGFLPDWVDGAQRAMVCSG